MYGYRYIYKAGSSPSKSIDRQIDTDIKPKVVNYLSTGRQIGIGIGMDIKPEVVIDTDR